MNKKNHMIALLITMITLLAMPLNLSAQDVPGAINYQGQLLDSGGIPITTQVTVVFSLWDSVTTGTQLGSAWSDSDSVTPDANGVYSTEIGDDPGNLLPTSALASTSVWLNVNIDGEDLIPRTRFLSVPYAIKALSANSALNDNDTDPLNELEKLGESFVIVQTTASAVTNGQNLKSAYTIARALTPHGDDRATTNRVTVIVPPGRYDLGTNGLRLDTEFVDLVGLSTARDDQYIFGLTSNFSKGVLIQTANNIRIENLLVECTLTTGFGIGNSISRSAYFPDDGTTTDTVVRNCTFKANDINAASTRPGIKYPGRFENCSGGKLAFGGGFGGDASGTFIDCIGGIESFGGRGTASGTFTDCIGGVDSFGGGSLGTASGTFTNCQGGTSTFGGGSSGTASGTFTNCQGGALSFGGGTTSGTFTNCIGGNSSFGSGSSGVTSGTFTNCVGGDNSFGGGSSGKAAGIFTNCVGGDGSFGGGAFANASGTFTNCKGGDGSFGGGAFGTASGTFTDCVGGDFAFGGDSFGDAIGTFSNCKGGNFAFGGGSSGTALGGKFYYCNGTGVSSWAGDETTTLFCIKNGVPYP